MLLFSCKPIYPPLFAGIDSYNFNRAEANAMEVQLNVKIKNPNAFNILIKKYDLNVIVNGTKIGQAKSKEKVRLTKQTEQAYPFYLQTDLQNVLAQILPGLSSIINNKPIELKLEGYIKGGAFGVSKKFPFSVTRPLEMKHLMKLKQ